jgi:hypothetical protein
LILIAVGKGNVCANSNLLAYGKVNGERVAEGHARAVHSSDAFALESEGEEHPEVLDAGLDRACVGVERFGRRAVGPPNRESKLDVSACDSKLVLPATRSVRWQCRSMWTPRC